MAHNVYSGKTVRIVAESAVAAGDVVISGGICGVAPYAIAAGATGILEIEGVFAIDNGAETAAKVGDAVFFAAATGKAYLAADTGRVQIGVVAEAAAAGAAELLVKLNAGAPAPAAAVADCTPAGGSATSAETTLNALLAALRAAGFIAPNAGE